MVAQPVKDSETTTAINTFFNNKRILLTGVANDQGMELIQMLIRCKPATLILADQDEKVFDQIPHLNPGNPAIKIVTAGIDISDEKAMEELFTLHQPQLVIHASMQDPQNNLSRAREMILKSGLQLNEES